MFIFRFEKLLKIKKDLIDKCMLEISNINTLIDKNKKMRSSLKKENIERKRKLDTALSNKPEKDMLLFMYGNIAKTIDTINEFNKTISNLENEKAFKMEEAKRLNIEKKKLDKLREKEYENYVKQENKLETRFLDEIANIKTANRAVNS